MTTNHLVKYMRLKGKMRLAVRAAVCALKRCQIARNAVIFGTPQEKL